MDLLVSKRHMEALSAHKSAERVDVTLRLVEAFRPSEKQKKRAMEIRKQDPVPLEQMNGHAP